MEKEARQIARDYGCFIVEKRDQRGPVWLLYRANPRPDGKAIFLGRRSSAAGIRELTEKSCIPPQRRKA
jgi:hypothetical protein